MEKEIAKLSAEAEANQSKYNEQTMAELVTRIQSRQRQYQRNSQQLQDEVNRERQDILGRVGKRFQDVVKKVAEEKGLDFVVDMNNLLFNKPALDISVEVTAAYDKAYPAKQ
jgi:Skp family chaperone for outer membrane proteins